MEALKTFLRLCLTALQWLFSLIAGGVMLGTLVTGGFAAAIVAAIAFIVVFPPLQRWIEAKLPFLQAKLAKLLLAFILLIATIFVAPAPTVARVCQAPVDNRCSTHEDELNVDQVDTAYVAIELPNGTAAEEATLALGYSADVDAEEPERDVVYTATKKLGDGKTQSLVFELPLAELPIGGYEAAIAIGDTNLDKTFELIGNPPRLNDIALCGTPEEAGCPANNNLYLEDAFDTLHLSATPQHVRAALPVDIAISYSPQPGDKTVLNTVSVTVSPEDSQVRADLPLPGFKVGTYEVTLSSAAEDFLSQTEVFTVWHDVDALSARVDGALTDSGTQISGFKLCAQTLSPEELAQLDARTDDQETEDLDDGDRCPSSETTFAVGTQTLAADVDFGSGFARSDGDFIDLTFVWRYLQGPSTDPQILQVKTYPIEPELSAFLYTLTGPAGGYPAGTYDVLVFFETNGAQPVRHEFVVE